MKYGNRWIKRTVTMLVVLCTVITLQVPALASFRDVDSGAWYYNDVTEVQNYGILEGVGNNQFDPQGTLSLAQAVTMAARSYAYLHEETINKTDSPWYSPYLSYALNHSICQAGEFGTKYDAPCSRMTMAILFERVLPKTNASNLNTINSLPDVREDGSGVAVYRLYREGILTGMDNYGTFHPDKTITRAETAAILNRLLDPSKRKSFTLEMIPVLSDQELLQIANSKVGDDYGYIFGMNNGALFETDWNDERHISGDSLSWFRVVDNSIQTMDDIKKAWYRHFAKTSVIPEGVFQVYREIDGAVYTCNGGIGGPYEMVSLDTVLEKTRTRAVLSGPLKDIWDEPEGKIYYTMVFEDGDWKCESLLDEDGHWPYYAVAEWARESIQIIP